MTRLIIYLILIFILITIPFSLPKKTDTKTSKVTSNSVKISLINQSVKKKKNKVRPKKKTQPKPKRKKKKLSKPKKVEKTEPKPQKEVFKKEELLPQVNEQISEPTINKSYEIRQTYYTYIRSTIEQNQIYPKKARRFKQQGEVHISFMIRYDGSISSLEIIRPSRYNTLNKAVKKMFKKLRFKEPPKELEHPLKITIPIKFTLK